MSGLQEVRGLFFDVFGTCVDWRSTVTKALQQAAYDAQENRSNAMSDSVRMSLKQMSREAWADFAQQWRTSYYKFTKATARGDIKEYKTIDQHHLESLYDLLKDHGLLESTGEDRHTAGERSLWTDEEIKDMSFVWHRLAPWPDTCRGILQLNEHYQTATLTNGNVALIEDMAAYGNMQFTHILSAEMFKSYKPDPAVYLGAAKKLGLEPSECAMVAAHLNDLQAAQKCGFRTIYVERTQEESFPELQDEPGLVDLWIRENENGFETVAARLRAVK